MTDNPTPNDIALLREAQAREVLERVANGPRRCYGRPAVIAAMLEFAALAPGQHDGAAGEGWRRGLSLAADIVEERDGDQATIDQLRTMTDSSPTEEWLHDPASLEGGLPAPTEQARAEGGWIVGNGDGTKWRTWSTMGPEWTADRDKATRYYRRQDAEAVHEADEDAWHVVPFTEVGDNAVGGEA